MAVSFPELQDEPEKRAALERVLASRTFRRSDQLKALLKYLCEKRLPQGESLDEYTVAVEALGRRRDYSTVEDGSVRNRVHSLRQRLEQYYLSENPDDPIRIVLPKGTYCPVFEQHSPTGASHNEPAAVAAAVPFSRWKWSVSLLTYCGVAIVAAAAGLAIEALRSKPPAVLAEAWGPLLEGNMEPLICLATPAQLALIRRHDWRLAENDRPTVTSPGLLGWYLHLGTFPPAERILLGPNLTSPYWGDVAGALAVFNILSRTGYHPEVLPESAIRLPALKNRNVIIIGRPTYSKIIDQYLRDKPFRISIPDNTHPTVIRNVRPRPGEMSEYDPEAESLAQNRELTFGLITMIPGGDNEQYRTLILSGTMSPGSQAAGEFFSSVAQMQNLKKIFRREGLFKFPRSYQVLIRCTTSGTSALDVQYVTHRVIRP
jgi:hypothetical protein